MPPLHKPRAVPAAVDVSITKGGTEVSTYNGRTRFVWSYVVGLHNRSSNRIQLKGRRLRIEGSIIEYVPFQRSAFAPSVGGEQRILEPNEPWAYVAAVVTDDAQPPSVEITLDAFDLDQNCRAVIEMAAFAFTPITAEPEKPGRATLVRADAERLCDAIEVYEFARQMGYGALFRPDDLGLTSEGLSLVNHYLIDYFRENRGKSIEVNLGPLMPDSFGNRLHVFKVIDHYFLKSVDPAEILKLSYILTYNALVENQRPADAGLSKKLAKLLEEEGFESVAKELLGHASPPQRALIAGMLSAEYSQAAATVTENAKPSLSAADRKAFQAASKKNPWTASAEKSPSEFITAHFTPWFDRGLTVEDIAAEQPELVTEYKREIVHNTRKRIRAISKPHKLPLGAKRPLNARLAAELTPEELRAKRDGDNARKRKSRGRPTHRPM